MVSEYLHHPAIRMPAPGSVDDPEEGTDSHGQDHETAGLDADSYPTVIRLCAKSGEGVDKLTQHLKEAMGYTGSTEGGFSARRRHLDALEQAGEFINNGHYQLLNMGAGELLAEDLRMAQQALGEITGQMSADDLLGKIFGSFCIGK